MKHLMLLAVLFLGVTWVSAQTTSSQDPASGQSSQMSKTSQSNTASQTTVEGCLSSANGSYTLTDSQGKAYQLMGDSAKLSKHVGHEVKITGTESAAGSASSNPSGMAGGSQMSIEVSSLKHISKTCTNSNSGGGMSH
ncbi:MAG: hypothetical protein WAN03_15155 [Candidatus Sulfotelmatobacter sp.]